MNWLDILLLLLILFSIVTSLRKGFSREIIGLIATLLAIVCGIWFYGTAGSFLLPYVSSPQIAHLAGFLLVFLGVMVLGAIAGAIVGRFIRTVGLSWFDRFLGGAFGLVRGVLLSVAVIMAIIAFSPNATGAPQAIVDSRLAPYIADAARLFVALAPRELKDGFHKHYEEAKAAWERTMHREPPKQEL
jgi:membrane protein required for colicin V production